MKNRREKLINKANCLQVWPKLAIQGKCQVSCFESSKIEWSRPVQKIFSCFTALCSVYRLERRVIFSFILMQDCFHQRSLVESSYALAPVIYEAEVVERPAFFINMFAQSDARNGNQTPRKEY